MSLRKPNENPAPHSDPSAQLDPAAQPAPTDHNGTSRRRFLADVGGATSAAIAAGVIGGGAESVEAGVFPAAPPVGPLTYNPRAVASYNARVTAAREERALPYPTQTPNVDEALYPNKIGSYSKGLPHNALGEADLPAYNSLLTALGSEDPADFENIILGSPLNQRRKLVNPQAGIAFDLQGADSHHLAMPAAPAFASAEESGEIVENYWMALLRDVPFTAYDTDPLALAAAAELSALSGFRGPR
jgi:hypothetical protein